MDFISHNSKLKPRPLWQISISIFIINLLWIFIGVWQLSILAIILFTFFSQNMKEAILGGIIGNSASWILYSIIGLIRTKVYILLSQVFQIITGIPNQGWIMFVIISLFAILLGFLGGICGYCLRMLIFSRIENKDESLKD